MRFPILAAVLLVLGCAAEPTTNPPGPGRQIVVVRGAAQVGRANEALPQPVIVAVQDQRGAAVAGALVRFTLGGTHGSLVTTTGITNADGQAAAVWQLGDVAGTQQLIVRADGAEERVVTASVGTPPCWLAECLEPDVGQTEPFLPVTLHTYDGADQAVHPDVLVRSGDRLPRAMVFTPYPFGNAGFEDPSIVESGNGRHWQVPAGVSNPLARPATGHLSDPDIVRDPIAGTERVYYREVAGGRNRIHLLESDDGVAWASRGVVLDVPSHEALSPAVVASGPHAPWQMWAVNSGRAGCAAQSTSVERRTSADGRTWSAPVRAAFEVPGQVIWHLDVQWIAARQEYWALVNTYARGGTCVTQALFLARSEDGASWQVGDTPLLVAGAVPAFRDIVYRSTFRLSGDGTRLELLLSGAVLVERGYHWSIGRMVVATQAALAGELIVVAPGDGWERPAPAHLPPPEPDDLPVEPGGRAAVSTTSVDHPIP